jgi:hypothetical protein
MRYKYLDHPDVHHPGFGSTRWPGQPAAERIVTFGADAIPQLQPTPVTPRSHTQSWSAFGPPKSRRSERPIGPTR